MTIKLRPINKTFTDSWKGEAIIVVNDHGKLRYWAPWSEVKHLFELPLADLPSPDVSKSS